MTIHTFTGTVQQLLQIQQMITMNRKAQFLKLEIFQRKLHSNYIIIYTALYELKYYFI